MAEIAGVGVDVVEVARVARAYARFGERLLDRVFTPRERRYCLGRYDVAHTLAGRFAAKEAVLKALSPEKPTGWDWREIEVASGGDAPRVELAGAAAEWARSSGITRIWLSISHEKTVAVALAVAER